MRFQKANMALKVFWIVSIIGVMAFAQEKKLAPALNSRDINGKTVDTKILLAKGPVIVWFWNSCCGLKKPQLTSMKDFFSKYNAKGLEIIAISEDGTKKLKDTKEAVAVNQMPFTIVMDNSMAILNQFKGFSVPSVYLITQDGNIKYYKSGYLPGDEKGLETELNTIFAAK